MIHGSRGPRIGIVCAQSDVACAHVGNQVTQTFLSEDNRIHIDLSDVFRGVLLYASLALGREHPASVIHAVGVACQVAACVRGADFQVWEFVERAVKNHVRKKDRRFKRISNHVAQQAISLQPLHGNVCPPFSHDDSLPLLPCAR